MRAVMANSIAVPCFYHREEGSVTWIWIRLWAHGTGKVNRPTTNDCLHHTLHSLSFAATIGCPALHENAAANSGMFTTTPLIR